MNAKSLGIAIVVIIIVLIGGYFIYTSMNSPATPAPQDTSPTADQTNQVQGQDVKVGGGLEARPGDTVSVLYVGKFTDGTEFDSSAAHGNQPLTFVLGSQGLIPGFQIGINGMKEGGQRTLAIPPSLAYGGEDVKDESGNVIIPANSTLIFEIQLVKVVPATSTPAAE